MALSLGFYNPAAQKGNLAYSPTFGLGTPASYSSPTSAPTGGFASMLTGNPSQPQGDLNSTEKGVLNSTGLGLQPIEGNSLDQYTRSLFNLGGQQYQNMMKGGQQGVGQAMDTSALLSGGAGQAMDTFAQMMQGGPQAQQFWSSILQGGPQGMAALSPQVQQNQMAAQNAKRQIATMGPMGGGRAAALSQLPMQTAAANSNLWSSLLPAAATNLGNLGMSAGTQLGNMGMSALGLLGNLGLGEQGQGNTLLNTILSGLMQGRGQDVQEHGQAMGLAGQLGSTLLGNVTAPAQGSGGALTQLMTP